jgi:hypothetical protein
MPLAFNSISHGTIAFGFFNIESDMLLLEHYFFFASHFCRYVEDIVEWDNEKPYVTTWPVSYIESSEAIGDLMGAIHGIRFSGFIGELYKRYPFPKHDVDFKQNPMGYQTQSIVTNFIANFAETRKISVTISNESQEVYIGNYRFNCLQFQELIKYVWRGGYPRWKDEIQPGYVTQMRNKIMNNPKGIFKTMDFSN